MSDERPERSGPEWDEWLRSSRLTGIEDADEPHTYRVTSQSGNIYNVRRRTLISRECGSMYFRWSCDCPARKVCRHIDAVVHMRWIEAAAAGDYDGMDIMEREEF